MLFRQWIYVIANTAAARCHHYIATFCCILLIYVILLFLYLAYSAAATAPFTSAPPSQLADEVARLRAQPSYSPAQQRERQNSVIGDFEKVYACDDYWADTCMIAWCCAAVMICSLWTTLRRHCWWVLCLCFMLYFLAAVTWFCYSIQFVVCRLSYFLYIFFVWRFVA